MKKQAAGNISHTKREHDWPSAVEYVIFAQWPDPHQWHTTTAQYWNLAHFKFLCDSFKNTAGVFKKSQREISAG